MIREKVGSTKPDRNLWVEKRHYLLNIYPSIIQDTKQTIYANENLFIQNIKSQLN